MRATSRRQDILDRIAGLPDDEWRTCRGCQMWLHRDHLARGGQVCPQCGHHYRLSAGERITQLVDRDSFVECERDLTTTDPLEFVDRMPYPTRVARAQRATGLTEAAVVGTATIGDRPVVLAVLDFAFLGGSMGSVVGEKVARAADLARDRGVPLITVASSGGARMQEAILSLLQMAKTAEAVTVLKQAGVPFVSVLADPVYGGVAASFAALGDVVIAETGTRAGFAGPQVIEQTIREKLPPRFQTAEFLHRHGHIDLVVDRARLPGLLSELIAYFAAARQGRLARLDVAVSAVMSAELAPDLEVGTARYPALDVDPGAELDAWEAVRLARHPERPTATTYLGLVFTNFVELHGDRSTEDDQAIVGGLAMLDESPVVMVAHAKGADTAENVRRNFGMPHPSGYAKARRLFRLAERLGVPVVTLVDTPGAYPGIRAEETNQSGAIAETIALSATLRVPVVCVVTGEGGSGGALALATADRLLMQENAVFSVISPEGCGTILFGDAGRAPDAARALRPRAADLYRMGLVDEIVDEPADGAHTDPTKAAGAIADALRVHLAELAALDPDDLVGRRHHRIRGYGVLLEPGAAAVDGGRDD